MHTLLAVVVETNPDALDVGSLHAAAYDVVRPLFDADRRRAVDRLAALLGSGDAHATLDAGEIVKAAHLGRIETLMLAEGAELWGRFDEATGEVFMGGEAMAAGHDLLDDVAARVLRHGATSPSSRLRKFLTPHPPLPCCGFNPDQQKRALDALLFVRWRVEAEFISRRRRMMRDHARPRHARPTGRRPPLARRAREWSLPPVWARSRQHLNHIRGLAPVIVEERFRSPEPGDVATPTKDLSPPSDSA